MNATILAVIGYIGWCVLLMVLLLSYRTSLVMKKERQPNEFSADGSDSPPFGQRLGRALANSLESFAFVVGPMLLALATDASAVTDPLALWVLLARVAQSLVHLISISALAVQVRFAFFIVQIAVVVYWLLMLFNKFNG